MIRIKLMLKYFFDAYLHFDMYQTTLLGEFPCRRFDTYQNTLFGMFPCRRFDTYQTALFGMFSGRRFDMYQTVLLGTVLLGVIPLLYQIMLFDNLKAYQTTIYHSQLFLTITNHISPKWNTFHSLSEHKTNV